MIKAVIFDMDGLLIDSEPLWRKGEIEVFKKRGIELTEDDCRSTKGMRVDEVMRHWDLKFPEAKLNCLETEKAVINTVAHLIDAEGKSMSGVNETIHFFNDLKIPMAIASASSNSLINKVLNKLNIKHEFTVVQSAEFMNYGKPHPEVFLEAAKRLNVKPENCLVFEDSVYGVIAAKAAKMKVIAIPDMENFDKKGYCIADYKLKTLLDFNNKIWRDLN